MNIPSDLWNELESLIQFTSISTIMHIYYRWRWYNKLAHAQVDKEVIDGICDTNNENNKCVLVNAKHSRIPKNFDDSPHIHSYTRDNEDKVSGHNYERMWAKKCALQKLNERRARWASHQKVAQKVKLPNMSGDGDQLDTPPIFTPISKGKIKDIFGNIIV